MPDSLSASPSAIEKYQMCPRRWAFSYLQGLWEPSSEKAEDGKIVHALLENGDPPYPDDRYGKLATEIWKHVPNDPVTGLEHKFDTELHGIRFKGVVDRLTENYIIDYKTTGSDLKWAKTPRKLVTDVQRLVYSEVFPDRPKALWLTGQWETYDVQPAELVVDRKKDKENFKLHVLTDAEQMMLLSPGLDPLSLPMPTKLDRRTGKPEACGKFPPAGCPHKDKCFPKVAKKTSLLDSLTKAEPEGLLRIEEMPVTKTVEESMSNHLIENLYIDCQPLCDLGEPMIYSYKLIAEASAEVAADMGVKSAMLIDFGKGPHMVVAQLVAMLEDRETPIKHLFLETRSAEGRAAMQELTSRAKFVVKGCY